MCFAPLRPAGPPGWVRLLELAGGVVLVGVVIAAVMTLRGRGDSLALLPSTLESAPVSTPAGPGQLALGGTATTFPSLTPTTVPPTRTPPPTVTQAPPQAVVASPSPSPLPQTGGPPPSPETTYIIRPGDTLLAIALQHSISLEQLLDANGMNNVNVLILPGQTLKIPKGDGSAPAPAQPAEATAAPVVQAPPPPEPVNNDPIGRITHTVRGGDSLWTIANRYGKTVDYLVALNGFRSVNQFLGIGDELLIDPGVTVTPRPPTDTPAPPTEAPPPTATPQPTETPAPTNTAAPTNTVAPTATRLIAEATTAPTAPAQAAAPGTPIALARYPAPTLLGVPDKTTLQGKAATLLNWTSVGVLAADEYYVVRISTTRDGKTVTEEGWTKATGWRLPESLLPTDKATTKAVYTWDVTVRRATERTPDGKQSGPAISPTSPVYEFTWTP